MTEPGDADGERAGERAVDEAGDAVAPDRVVHCRWCRKVIVRTPGPGRPREFCSQRCRQWDWVARQRAQELALADGELVVARAELDALHDDLYVLACAVDDVDRDLAQLGARPSIAELRELLEWLLQAARPLRDRELAAPSGQP